MSTGWWQLSEHEDWPADAGVVDDGLDAHNAPSVVGVRPLACLARDAQRRVLGGALGRTWGECAELQQLWVLPEQRQQGLGRALMQRFEAAAVQRGVRRVYLTTFSFQAPRFYAALGYAEQARIEGFGGGHVKYLFLRELPHS
ncbi:GNAT family N-acetyltransferase [Ideonella sp. 4Y11]|uniref:GNAT family N-acetyltransferase n=1 Tax=Ideonella aquatica TaxID=2824119 RepID=A0A941BFB0_9BURK|nr:GNAT family N-acetyltransferase [Ideonella aquatica]MBQ0958571.1 GNAT family N-acetyltransferase [Ideonella aquatica]